MDNNMMNQGGNEPYEGGQNNMPNNYQQPNGYQPYGQNGYQPYGPNGGYDYGQPYAQYNQPYQQPYGQESIYAQPGEGGGDTKAVVSLILGILSILTCCCYGVVSIVLGIIAIVLAVLAKKDNMGKMPGMAIGGLICGIIGLVMGVLFIVFMIYGVVSETTGYY
ncbi:MAG: hypothetical protein J1E61_03425 [Lachnospiraceae bacterium]|nr:hypothetical protein [Lachnospiraceae bacterium]